MTIVWVVYDISDDNARGEVARACLDAGLYRVQKSVFIGALNRNEMDTLALKCKGAINAEEDDSVYIFPMDEASFKKVKIIGKGFDKKLVANETITKFF